MAEKCDKCKQDEERGRGMKGEEWRVQMEGPNGGVCEEG